jgi:manganese/zinc/iron transport system permease protein
MSEVLAQFLRFWSFQDRAVQTAITGVLLLALGCGSLGCFLVLRKLSLMGDSLGHAVLPGVCLGFMAAGTKDLRWIFGGAVLAALIGSWLIGIVQRYTRLKPDVALGLVLSGFFGLGLVMLARLQKLPGGDQSGLDQFLFGQVSAIHERDLWLMGGMALSIVAGVIVAFKELVVTSFDEGFAASIGIPVRGIHFLLMTLTALAIVISIQAVGVVLLSALLITPAATALLLTDRLRTLVVLSVLIAMVGGVAGLNLSFLGNDLASGPFIVVVLAAIFLAAYLFAPRYGLIPRSLRRARRGRRTRAENLLKSIHQLAESSGAGATAEVEWARLAEQQTLLAPQLRSQLRELSRLGWLDPAGDCVRLSALGISRARELERNYRLWELFLTHEVQLPADHTQRDAEDLEHLLTPELVHELETRYAQRAANE